MALRVTIGFAFGDREEGVAYARVLGSREPEHVQRITVPFRPQPLAMPYVLLGCALNRFKSASVRLGDAPACRDLTARARADISINVAA